VIAPMYGCSYVSSFISTSSWYAPIVPLFAFKCPLDDKNNIIESDDNVFQTKGNGIETLCNKPTPLYQSLGKTPDKDYKWKYMLDDGNEAYKPTWESLPVPGLNAFSGDAALLNPSLGDSYLTLTHIETNDSWEFDKEKAKECEAFGLLQT
jgi:hypothetical protein